MQSNSKPVKVLFIGDIVGKSGLKILSRLLKELLDTYDVDLCIANGENAHLGKGLNSAIINELFGMGIHVITSGNHIWDKNKVFPVLETNLYVLRPINYPEGNPGHGSVIYTIDKQTRVGVVNAQGRTFMYSINCPFKTVLEEIKRIRKETKIIIVDFHAEATSEKLAFAYYLEGKVSAIIGTHTHVQTADERIMQKGTAYITDVGMTGPYDSVIGINKKVAIRRFIYQIPVKYEVSESDNLSFNGVLVTINRETGKALDIKRLSLW